MSAKRRRGAVLLEVLLSVALFAGSAAFCLAVTSSLFEKLHRSDRRQFVTDLARSKMAELEAGLVSIQDLRGEWSGAVGSRAADDLEARGRVCEIDVDTSRTEYAGLSLVELTVREGEIAFTLRQLVALREIDVEAYEPDDLLEGLP